MRNIRNYLVVFISILFIPHLTLANDNTNDVDSHKSDQAQSISLIDINQADVKTLAKLKGVGQKKAQAIVNYREVNGNFKSINDLLKIKGIGVKVLKDNMSKLAI